MEREEVGNPALSGLVLEAPFRGGTLLMSSGSLREGGAKPSVAGDALPQSPFTVTVRKAHISVRGPWTLSWLVPGAEERDAPVSPLTLRPEDVGQTRGPLSLTIDGATLTDRLTAVHLAAGPLPSDAEVRFPSGSDKAAPYLQDDRGRRYELEEDVGWEPEDEAVERSGIPHTLTFEPLQPLARRVTLRVPQVELVLPDQASFDVTVPAGIELEPRFEVTREPPFADPPHTTISWRSSDPWEVDVTLEAAGYRIHLSQACLQRFGRTTQIALTSEPFWPRPGDYWLTGLWWASGTGPEEEDTRLEGGFDLRRFFEDRFPAETRHRAVLTFRDLENEPVPGRYHVEIDGFRVLVHGPWELSWHLPSP